MSVELIKVRAGSALVEGCVLTVAERPLDFLEGHLESKTFICLCSTYRLLSIIGVCVFS